MHPSVPRSGMWESAHGDLSTVVDPQVSFLESVPFLGPWIRSVWKKRDGVLNAGAGRVAVEECGLRVTMGDWAFDLDKCGLYKTEVSMGDDGAMLLELHVADPKHMEFRQVLKRGETVILENRRELTHLGDIASTESTEKDCDCVQIARWALEWAAAERAFGDEAYVSSLTTPDADGLMAVSTWDEFKAALEDRQTTLVREGLNRANDEIPAFDIRRRFLEKCDEYAGGGALGWVDEHGQHSFNEEALESLPEPIVDAIHRHENIHQNQVAETGWPATNSAEDMRKLAAYEAAAYHDSYRGLMDWIRDQCRPGMIPDAYPYIANV